jgi:hypothetical protein
VISRRKKEAWEKREKWVGGKNNKKRKVAVVIRVCRFLFFIVPRTYRTYNEIINWVLLN